MRESMEAQVSMFPNIMNHDIRKLIEKYKDEALGWKISGAGGGGYLILVSDHHIPNALRITIRRRLD
jgi:galactokinase/mevalonate kinase-like predicted kinase